MDIEVLVYAVDRLSYKFEARLDIVIGATPVGYVVARSRDKVTWYAKTIVNGTCVSSIHDKKSAKDALVAGFSGFTELAKLAPSSF